MNTITRKLKAELWRRFGTSDYPAEWDGRVHGGGKLSQRHWEYFIGVGLLDLAPDSSVLDLGGGSPATGAGFFASLLAREIRKVTVLDPNVAEGAESGNRVELIRALGDHETVAQVLKARPDITHISSISVLEHIQPTVRAGIISAINECFNGESFVATFEFPAVSESVTSR